MKKLFSFLFLFSLIHLLPSCATEEKRQQRDIASLRIQNKIEGIWFLQGTSSVRGPYNGELELRRGRDGIYTATRVVTYINNFFNGLKIQEIWTGKAVADGNVLTVSYDLEQGDFLTSVNGSNREPADFKNTVTVLERFLPSNKGLAADFSDKKIAKYTEWLTTRRELETKPLWSDARQKIDAKGARVPVSIQKQINIAKGKLNYGRDPFVKSYKSRKEYENEEVTFIFDPTDFDFYRQNKDTIRVINKFTDNITVTEAVIKRNAYAPSLEDKAYGYDRNTVSNHINDQGLIASLAFDEQGHRIGYESDEDSTTLTGMYITSQAMRYLAAKDNEALRNVRRTLRGLFTLMDVTGDSSELAKSVTTAIAGRTLSDKWHPASEPFQNTMWLEGGDSETVRAISQGLLWASVVIPESDTEIWSHLKEKSRRLLNLKTVIDKPQVRSLVLGLAAWLNKDRQLQEQYAASFSSSKSLILGYSFSSSFYWRGNADWSEINKNMSDSINHIVIADRLGEYKIRDRWRERLMDSWVVYAPAQRHLLTIAAYGFAYSSGIRGDRFLSESKDEKFQNSLNQAVWGLREISYPRPNISAKFDHSMNPEWCVSPIPKMFWKDLKRSPATVASSHQGLYGYPAFEGSIIDSNNIWDDEAFRFKGERTQGVERPGVDYLYAYWMARYSKVGNLN